MATPKVLGEINNVLDGIGVAAPEFLAVYSAIKMIWTIANPGKTDADFNGFLLTQANKTTSDADAILTGKGFTRDPVTGIWHPPAVTTV